MNKEILFAVIVAILLTVSMVYVLEGYEFERYKQDCRASQRTTNIECFGSIEELKEFREITALQEIQNDEKKN